MDINEMIDMYMEDGLTRELAAARVCQDVVLKAISIGPLNRNVISILKSEPQFNHVSEKEACCIVERVLGNVQLYLQDMSRMISVMKKI